MKKYFTLFAVSVVALGLITAAAHAQVEQAQPPTPPPPPAKHDSNTLHRWGRAIQYPFQKAGKHVDKSARKAGAAIQYPVRKAGENASVTTHTVMGKKSVVHNRQTGQNELVNPTTQVTPTPSGSNGTTHSKGDTPANSSTTNGTAPPANTQSDNNE